MLNPCNGFFTMLSLVVFFSMYLEEQNNAKNKYNAKNVKNQV
jgi:hypothetical protein